MSDSVTTDGLEKNEQDLRFLMNHFKKVLVGAGEEELVAQLPWGDERSGGGPISTKLMQACSIAFQLLNMVEENAANQMRRKIEREQGPEAWKGLWARTLKKIKDAGNFGEDEILKGIANTRIEPVLTAHPTEAKRITVLEQHRELYVLLVQLEYSIWTPSERKELELKLQSVLERMWRTGEVYLTKPTVESERKAIAHYLQDVFPVIIERLDKKLVEAWSNAGFDPEKLSHPLDWPKVRFGTWVGGDRDGHPFVTPQVTEDTLQDLRLRGILIQKSNLESLRASLSLSAGLQVTPKSLKKRMAEIYDLIGGDANVIVERNPEEPWRQFVSLMIERLPLHSNQKSGELAQLSTRMFYAYRSGAELLSDLLLLREALLEVKAHSLVRQELDPAIRRCEVFGFHLAKLDIRQNSDYYNKAAASILALHDDGQDYLSWPESRKVAFLSSELYRKASRTTALSTPEGEAKGALQALAVVARHVRRYGSKGVGALILSMTHTMSDLLTVYFLAKEAGLMQWEDDRIYCPIPVVPLFETVEDLKSGPEIMENFITHPVTRDSFELQRHNNISGRLDKTRGEVPRIQQVMIGYSDSNKDKGIIASQWGLHQAQRKMVDMAARHGIRIRFFHGKGGTISRGAGPTDSFLDALPSGSASFDLRLTEQGETIAQKYSNLLTASYNLEMLSAGVFYHSFPNPDKEPPQRLHRILDDLADASALAYQNLMRQEGFIAFYRQVTPIDVLEKSRIGSRPSRRTGAQSIDDLRAIPWVFSWTQCRFFLTGWYGSGTALADLKKERPEDFEFLKEHVGHFPFLRYVLTNIEASVISSDRAIMDSYGELVEDESLRTSFMSIIHREREACIEALADLLPSALDGRRPFFSRTVTLRNQALRPLHGQQVQLLRRWRELTAQGEESQADALLPELFLSVSAIASGLKTTG